MPLGAKVETISLKASSSRQKGGKVSETYTDGIDNIRSRTPCPRRFPGTACRPIGGLPYGHSQDFINFVENPPSHCGCAGKAIFLHRYAFSSAPGEVLPLTPTLAGLRTKR